MEATDQKEHSQGKKGSKPHERAPVQKEDCQQHLRSQPVDTATDRSDSAIWDVASAGEDTLARARCPQLQSREYREEESLAHSAQ